MPPNGAYNYDHGVTMSPAVDTAPPPVPVPAGERILAPDLARGFALLLVALAHTAGFVYMNVPGLDPAPEGLTRGYSLVMIVFVHACALPLFVMLFGYGLVQFTRHQRMSGIPWPTTRRVLVRRYLGMVVIGALHGALLFSGDIVGAFGVVGLAFSLLLLRPGGRVRDWILRSAPIYVLGAGIAVAVLAGLAYAGIAARAGAPSPLPVDPSPSQEATTYGASLIERVVEWPVTTLVFLPFVLMVWVGAWAARRRVLEEPERHQRLLTTGLVGGFTIAIAGALPMGLLAGGFVELDAETAGLARTVYEMSGFFGGIGYACLFGLVGRAMSRHTDRWRSNAVVGSIVALGQRSLSGYLVQSLAWLVLLAPFGLHLARDAESPATVAVCCAIGVWLASVLVAGLMHRRGHRGPIELLLRRFAYRDRTAPR